VGKGNREVEFINLETPETVGKRLGGKMVERKEYL